jgi:hypothetical protein
VPPPGVKYKKLRALEAPDFTYKGAVFQNGVTEQLRVIPSTGSGLFNGQNLFKNCIFGIEMQQDYSVNSKLSELLSYRDEVRKRLDS